MLEIRLQYQGEGRFTTATRLDLELAERNIDHGERIAAKLTKPRSVRQNRLFHALIELAFDHQKAGPPQPSWRHLKSWLLIQAGWCTIAKLPPNAISKEMAACLKAQFDTIDFTTDGQSIFMKTAKSTKFSAANADEFSPVMDKVIDLICSKICPGMEREALMKMAMEASGGAFVSAK